MDLYHIVLFLHIVMLLVATGATVVAKIAVGRRFRARTVVEALEWHNVLISASRFFPISLAAFVITGWYMVSMVGAQAWRNGFIVAGLVGVTLLLASGTYLGVKGKALKQVLERLTSEAPDRPAPSLIPPTLVALLPMINTGVALSVAFDMVTKPVSIPIALGIVALGAVVGAALALRHRAADVAQQAGVARTA